jgi:hypothetical protein
MFIMSNMFIIFYAADIHIDYVQYFWFCVALMVLLQEHVGRFYCNKYPFNSNFYCDNNEHDRKNNENNQSVTAQFITDHIA